MITVLGAGGFIGSHLVRYLRAEGVECWAPGRDEPVAGRPLGHVVYAIGLTADFRERPLDTIEAHVCRLLALVRAASFDSLLYLSSTRVYRGGEAPAREGDALRLSPADPEDIYALSKAAGEALVLSLGARGRVARLSNVYGRGQDQTFLSMLIDEARDKGRIVLRTAADSSKDYLAVDDAVRLLAGIAREGRHRLYNVASGVPVAHGDLAAAIARETSCEVRIEPGAPIVRFPRIDIDRIRAEFGFEPRGVLADVPDLLAAGR
ncbi:MAG: NAD-dependent epimerase/dehydratase family protein [Allosphingosinicella sp.]